ncbi:MAG TPA: carboxypeptidase-like regulatory domain-containing protein, partial [Pyrinomonadaceae bacterium]
MRIARTIITSFLVVGGLFCFSGPVYPQGTNLGSIRGAVTDPKGAAVPNASVKITDLATNISRDLTSNSQGDYELAGLKSGKYRVAITAPGFKTTSIDAVLSGSDVVR